MAKSTKTAPAEPVVEATTEEADEYAGYLEKPATDLQTRFAEFIKEKTGIVFSSKANEAAFDEGVRLGVALRMKFQASPENQAVNGKEARAARLAEKEAATEPPAPKAAKSKAAKSTAPAEETAPPVAAAPAKPAKKAGKSKAAPF